MPSADYIYRLYVDFLLFVFIHRTAHVIYRGSRIATATVVALVPPDRYSLRHSSIQLFTPILDIRCLATVRQTLPRPIHQRPRVVIPSNGYHGASSTSKAAAAAAARTKVPRIRAPRVVPSAPTADETSKSDNDDHVLIAASQAKPQRHEQQHHNYHHR